MPAHNDIAFRLRARFEQAHPSAALDGWEFVTDVDIDFQLDPEEVRAPDVAGFRRERWLPAWRLYTSPASRPYGSFFVGFGWPTTGIAIAR